MGRFLRGVALCAAMVLPAAAWAAELDADDAVRLMASAKVLPLRHISGDADRAGELPPDLAQGIASTRRVVVAGRQRVLLLLDVGHVAEGAEGYAALALIDPATPDGPRLLDAANVAYDRLTGFHAPGALRVGQGEDVALVSSGHSNSSQSYQTVAMIGLRGDRLRLIDTVFTFGDAACGYQRTQRPRFTAQGGTIRVQVTEAVRHTGPACEGQPRLAVRQRRVVVDYRWRAGVYRKSSDALERLAGESAERF